MNYKQFILDQSFPRKNTRENHRIPITQHHNWKLFNPRNNPTQSSSSSSSVTSRVPESSSEGPEGEGCSSVWLKRARNSVPWRSAIYKNLVHKTTDDFQAIQNPKVQNHDKSLWFVTRCFLRHTKILGDWQCDTGLYSKYNSESWWVFAALKCKYSLPTSNYNRVIWENPVLNDVHTLSKLLATATLTWLIPRNRRTSFSEPFSWRNTRHDHRIQRLALTQSYRYYNVRVNFDDSYD